MKRAAFLFMLSLAWPLAANADVIEHKNGQNLEGRIVSENVQEVTLEVEGMDMVIERTDIRNITRGPVKPKPRKAVKPTEPPVAQAAAQTPPAQPALDLSKLEKPLIVFDERKWKLGYQNAYNNQVVAAFYPEGQSKENWTEQVLAQLFIGLRSEPGVYAEYTRRQTASRCPKTVWRAIRQTPDDILYEWSVKDCEGVPDQSEIARAYLGQDGLHVLHYAIKIGEMPESNRQKWIQGLEATQFVKP